MKYLADVDGQTFTIDIDHPHEVVVDGKTYQVDLQVVDQGSSYSLLVNGESYDAFVERHEGVWTVQMTGERHTVMVEDENLGRLRRMSGAKDTATELVLKAPMPGLVVAVRVEPGQVVSQGQGVVILEAMKMENELRASRGATVKTVKVQPGQAVNQGEPLIVFE